LPYRGLGKRLSAIESQIADLRSLIFQCGSESDAENRKSKAEGEIRTRVVASTGPIFEYKPQNELTCASTEEPKPKTPDQRHHQSLISLELDYGEEELTDYTAFRCIGVTAATIPWINKCSETYWKVTKGVINKARTEAFREYVLSKYTGIYSKRKMLSFAKAFLRYLTKMRLDTRYKEFDLFLEMPKTVKESKRITERIVTIEDIKNVLSAIDEDNKNAEFTARQRQNYKALVLFGAYTGQRPYATIRNLTVGQFRAALQRDPPVLDVLPHQDKIRMGHYVPLHPCVVKAATPLLEGRNRKDDTRIFAHEYFDKWARRRKIPLLHGEHFVCGDLRKFAEQHGDIIQWDQSNKNYILTHGVSGVDWRFYKHPLPENVYDVYLHYWKDVEFS
jgi:hypothetical protein